MKLAARAGSVTDVTPEQLRGYMAEEPFREWWPSGRDLLQPEFVEYVEREILPVPTSGETLHWKP